eukprot:4525297-Pyramimonas_sp.AAC.1
MLPRHPLPPPSALRIVPISSLPCHHKSLPRDLLPPCRNKVRRKLHAGVTQEASERLGAPAPPHGVLAAVVGT